MATWSSPIRCLANRSLIGVPGNGGLSTSRVVVPFNRSRSFSSGKS